MLGSGPVGRSHVRGMLFPSGQLLESREPEVEDADPAIGAKHRIVRLEVAMDDAARVGDCQRAASLTEHTDDLSP